MPLGLESSAAFCIWSVWTVEVALDSVVCSSLEPLDQQGRRRGWPRKCRRELEGGEAGVHATNTNLCSAVLIYYFTN